MNVYDSTYLHAHRVFNIQHNPICTAMFFWKSHLITFYFLSSDLGWKAIWNASKPVANGREIHHLETRWRNSRVLDMYWFIMAPDFDLLGVAPSTFTTVDHFFVHWLHSPETNSLLFAPWTCLKGNIESGKPSIFRCIFVSLEGMELHNNHQEFEVWPYNTMLPVSITSCRDGVQTIHPDPRATSKSLWYHQSLISKLHDTCSYKQSLVNFWY